MRVTKFDRETFATTGFLKEGDIGPVLLGPAEVVKLGRAEVSLGPAEVVMIIKNTRYDVNRVFVKDNKDDNDEPRHSRLIT